MKNSTIGITSLIRTGISKIIIISTSGKMGVKSWWRDEIHFSMATRCLVRLAVDLTKVIYLPLRGSPLISSSLRQAGMMLPRK
jgi:hypothetical protein